MNAASSRSIVSLPLHSSLLTVSRNETRTPFYLSSSSSIYSVCLCSCPHPCWTFSSRRSISYKHQRSADMSTQVNLGSPCCCSGNLTSKNQRALKRELLHCSQERSVDLDSPAPAKDLEPRTNRRSKSLDTRVSNPSVDHLGSWPNLSVIHLRSDGSGPLPPLKNGSHEKPSSKHPSDGNETAEGFQFHPLLHTYITEYRKQKGYLLDVRAKASIPRSVAPPPPPPVPISNEQPSMDRTPPSLGQTNTPPSMTKVFHDSYAIRSFPSIPARHGYFRPSRYTHRQPAVPRESLSLPSLTHHHPTSKLPLRKERKRKGIRYESEVRSKISMAKNMARLNRCFSSPPIRSTTRTFEQRALQPLHRHNERPASCSIVNLNARTICTVAATWDR